jgi:succinoglycan biosynthesis protein ExoV
MKLIYFHSKHGNFGDDLNAWLWPKLFPTILQGDESTGFIGIGSILGRTIGADVDRRIIFGSGIRFPKRIPALDASWDVRFVRGPITARSLGLDEHKVISDGAICLGLLPWEKPMPADEVGFIPHYHFIQDYPSISFLGSGIKTIDPRKSVDEVVAAMRNCKTIVTESLHGAILADLFRIPWVRVSMYSWQSESPDISSIKWLDWAFSLNLDSFPGATLQIPYFRHRLSRVRRTLTSGMVNSRVAKCIHDIVTAGNFQLSEEPIFRLRVEQAHDAVEKLRKDYFA